MKLHPLILSTADVQAIIAGRKTRHTVPIKWPKVPEWHDWDYDPHIYIRSKDGKWWPEYRHICGNRDEGGKLKSPFGSPGDQEWQTGYPTLKEWYWVDYQADPIYFDTSLNWQRDFGNPIEWKRMGSIIYVREAWSVGSRPDPFAGSIDGFEYKADTKYIDDIEDLPIYPCEDFDFGNFNRVGWQSPATMPREASRIYLEVTDVVCKRVQEITEEEAKAEGVKPAHCENHKLCPSVNCKNECQEMGHYWNYNAHDGEDFPAFSAKESYKTLLESTGRRDIWNNNDFVFSCSFKVLSINGKPSYL